MTAATGHNTEAMHEALHAPMEENEEQSADTVPFVVSNVDQLEEQAAAGKHPGYQDEKGVYQCARLPLAWQNEQDGLSQYWNRGSRLTPNWIMGDEVQYGMALEKGTVLATFDRAKGIYTNLNSGQGGENHTVIFLGWVAEEPPRSPMGAIKNTKDFKVGMRVIEQVNSPPRVNTIWFDPSKPYFQNAGRFNVVRLKK